MLSISLESTYYSATLLTEGSPFTYEKHKQYACALSTKTEVDGQLISVEKRKMEDHSIVSSYLLTGNAKHPDDCECSCPARVTCKHIRGFLYPSMFTPGSTEGIYLTDALEASRKIASEVYPNHRPPYHEVVESKLIPKIRSFESEAREPSLVMWLAVSVSDDSIVTPLSEIFFSNVNDYTFVVRFDIRATNK